MLADILSLAGGLALLLVGGQLLVSGAVALATRLRISTLVIGLTIVAWGTSAPELFLNVTAALSGRAELSFGNLVGANIANLGLILGFGAMIRPIAVHTAIVRTELPIALWFFVLMSAAGGAYATGGAAGGRLVALLLLLSFAAYSGFAVRAGLKERRADRPLETAVQDTAEPVEQLSLWLTLAMLAGGVSLLKLGGDVAVEGASSLATRLHVPADIIGLTIVAFGTTLPEFMTMIAGQRRGQGDLVMGNALGSCVFNAGAVYGSVLMISPMPLPDGGSVALAVMVGLGAITIPLTVSQRYRLMRREGGVLLGIYVGFTIYQVWRAASGGNIGP